MKFIERIFKKKSRVKLDNFLKKNSSCKLALEIGATSKKNAVYFPNLVTLNYNNKLKDIDIVANAEKLNGIIEDDKFDIVLCLSVLEHTLNPTKLLSEAHRILKKNGILILSVPFVMPLHDCPNDYWRFTKYGVIEITKKYFNKILIDEDMNSLETIGYLFHRLFMQTRVLNVRYFNVIFLMFSKVLYFFKGIISKEYGSVKKDFDERNILSNNIYFIGEKKVIS